MKITKTIIKSFINREMKAQRLYIKSLSEFDSMDDSIASIKGSEWHKATPSTNLEYRLGINGAWFVGNSRDFFETYEDDNFIGYKVLNCCGSFLLAFKRK